MFEFVHDDVNFRRIKLIILLGVLIFFHSFLIIVKSNICTLSRGTVLKIFLFTKKESKV